MNRSLFDCYFAVGAHIPFPQSVFLFRLLTPSEVSIASFGTNSQQPPIVTFFLSQKRKTSRLCVEIELFQGKQYTF